MSAKFTPGPWRVKYSKFSIVETHDGAQVAECKNLTGLVNLQANSRLIAAAPELLEALETLLSLHDARVDTADAWNESMEEARVVIDKATGESK